MKVLLLFVIVLVHQNLQFVQSSPSETDEKWEAVQSYIDATLQHFSFARTHLTTAIYDDCSKYIEDGLEEINQLLNIEETPELTEAHEMLSRKINSCISEADEVIDNAVTKFKEIKERAYAIQADLDDLQSSIELDDDDNELIEEFRLKYESKVLPIYSEFIKELQGNAESARVSVKRCVEKFSEIGPLFRSTEMKLKKVQSDIKLVLEHLEEEMAELTNQIHDECSSHILKAMHKMKEKPNFNSERKEYEQISSKIIECCVETDVLMDTFNTKFNEILYDARQALTNRVTETQIKNENTKEMPDNADDTMNDIRDQFQATVYPKLKEILRELKVDSISVLEKVPNCAERIFKVIVSSRTEL